MTPSRHPTRSAGRPCSGPIECRTTAGPGEVDSVFVTSMLGAHTHPRLMDKASQLSNF